MSSSALDSLDAIDAVIATARLDERRVLLETEGLQLLQHIGIETPSYFSVQDPDEVSDNALALLPGELVVVKAVSPDIPHRNAVGGVQIVPKSGQRVRGAIAAMASGLSRYDLRGFTIHEFVPHPTALGAELLIGLRWSAEFGPVIVCGLGGVETELLTRSLEPGTGLALSSPQLTSEHLWRDLMIATLAGELLTSRYGESCWNHLIAVYHTLARASRDLFPDRFAEIEINPLVARGDRWLALDVLVEMPGNPRVPLLPRPLDKIASLLQPSSIAVAGVSRSTNPGRIILDNVLAMGFDRHRLYVVKGGVESVAGCRAVPDLESLPEKVDLLIVAVGARGAMELIDAAIAERRAESLIVVTGGLGEKEGTGGLVSKIRSALARSRKTQDRGPVINGPNCLGIRSQPGHYDSLFIPRPKLSALATASSVGKSRPGSDAAFISQSGALLAAKLSRLPDLDFRYCISVGNQIDLTLGDFLTFLQDDPSVRLFVVYAEGFQPLDGLRFLEAAARIRRRHGTVLLYRAGRSQAGAHAAASHTATLVGDYTVAAALARSADVVLADSLGDFEDLISMFASLQRPRGKRLAVVTNAGFESVAASDNLGGLELATFSDPTKARLHSILIREQLIGVVDVTNPLDLTPMAGDEAFEEAVRIVLEDENVDLGVVGCVPLTPALNTLAAGRGHREDVHGTDSIARRLVRLKGNLDKPWITTIDSGTAYDPLKRLLEKEGIPTFAAIDRAVRLLSTFARHTTASVEG